MPSSPLKFAHAPTRAWFARSFQGATKAQRLGWEPISEGESTLLLAPTGSGKTLAAFLVAIDRLLFLSPPTRPAPPKGERAKKAPGESPKTRVLYVSPLKALAVDVERNLRAPLAGIVAEAERAGVSVRVPTVGVRSGDTTPQERARMKRNPPDVLITTPESLYLLLTSQAAAGLASVETVIIDEIHSLVPTKRGAHLAVSLERLEGLRGEGAPPLQRIGLSATQRPLEEVAKYLGGLSNGAFRPVTIVDAGATKDFDLKIEVPVEDMARLGDARFDGPAPSEEAVAAALHADSAADESSAANGGLSSRGDDERPEGVGLDDLRALSERAPNEGAADAGISASLQRERTEREGEPRPLDEANGEDVAGDGDALGDGGLADDGDVLYEGADDLPPAFSFASDEDDGLPPEFSLDGSYGDAGFEDTGLPPLQSGAAAGQAQPASIWPAIHPRLVRLIRDHRSTMIFCNSRRLAERLAGAINELAGEELALAHHGSIAKDIRANIEDRLKRGELPAIVATSSLELGIDIGAVDLVIQIEAPLSVASGIQRIGRAGHQVGAVSRGVIFPKYRGDLVACAAVTDHIHQGRVESTRYLRNPLDVLAQQVVAEVAQSGPLEVEALYGRMCSAANFAELPRESFDGVLDMLSGRYPSEQFGELRPRITWDRIAGVLTPRKGAKMLAVANAGTIPDRGLYGVFLAGAEKPVRVGELDEEMVFESREGEIFLLGASSWRIEEITHDRVLVSPAPGQPGKMPFWHGDRPGRPAEFGRAIGALTRELMAMERGAAEDRLVERHGLDRQAADNLLRYLADQKESCGHVPTDRRIVVERFEDELGDACVAILSPFGNRVHSPWATAVQAKLLNELAIEADIVYSDDGIVFRMMDGDRVPDDAFFFPEPDEVEELLTGRLGETALFAARFRENAGRALLLPRRRPGQRTPLWAQRRKSASLLRVAAGFRNFPIVLETYRECLQDVFDLPELRRLLRDLRDRKVRVSHAHSKRPSPFAGALLFNYVANFMYEGDAPLAERRAQALALDPAQLRALLGEPEMRELLEASAIEEVENALQRREQPIRHADALHDRLLALGDRALAELGEGVEALIEELERARRVVRTDAFEEARWFALEDVARYRDALGLVPPAWTPSALLMPANDALTGLVARYAKTHGPFRADAIATRYGLGIGPVLDALQRLVDAGRVLDGEFLPESLLEKRGLSLGQREFCDADVLARIKRRSLAKLRQQIEPVSAPTYARFLARWQQLEPKAGRGFDALLNVIEQLQGQPIPASDLESAVLPARVRDFDPRDLDELLATGDVVWRGLQSLGSKEGRVGLYVADHYPLLAPPLDELPEGPDGDLARELVAIMESRGAVFFRDLVSQTGRLGTEVFDVLWDLVWSGRVTNDTLLPLRSLRSGMKKKAQRRGRRIMAAGRRSGRGRRAASLPGSEGRWSLLPEAEGSREARFEALVRAMLENSGVLTREAVARAAGSRDDVAGFGGLYPVLKAMEEVGRVRRGYFVEGLGATQFALPGCEDRLRDERDAAEGEDPRVWALAADDPASPYGAAVPWSAVAVAGPGGAKGARPTRSAGARVVLIDGHCCAFIGATGERLLTFLPSDEPQRSRYGRALAEHLAGQYEGAPTRGAALFSRIDGENATDAAFAAYLLAAGFKATPRGLHRRYGERSELPSYFS
ncbi:MAG: DEAD/DEAH box helicase [Myxococcota bacterium]